MDVVFWKYREELGLKAGKLNKALFFLKKNLVQLALNPSKMQLLNLDVSLLTV